MQARNATVQRLFAEQTVRDKKHSAAVQYSTIIFLLVVPLVSLLPTLCVRCCCRPPVKPATATSGSTNTIAAADIMVSTLDSSRRASEKVRARVAFATTQLGWFLLVFSIAPLLAVLIAGNTRLIEAAAGSTGLYFSLLPWSLALLLLRVRPNDHVQIRRCTVLMNVFLITVTGISAGLAAVPSALTKSHTRPNHKVVAAIASAVSGAFVRTQASNIMQRPPCHGCTRDAKVRWS